MNFTGKKQLIQVKRSAISPKKHIIVVVVVVVRG